MSDTNYGINSAFSQIGAASSDVIRSRYWDPYLDVASRVLPKDLKSVWNMSLYYAMSHPIIAPLIHKKSTYVVTRPIYETTDSETRQRYTEVMERVLKIREFLAAFNMDYNTFGNAYASVGFPFIKILKCRSCGHVVPAEQVDYKIEGLEFIMPRCPKCFKRTRVDVKDVYYRTTRGMRLIRWNPQHVIVEENPVNGHCTYYLRPPPALENALRVGRKSIINNTPQELIDAIRKKRDLRFDSGQRMPGGAVFASKRLGPSNSTYRGYGIPLIMPALKDAFLMQIMRKAQECVGPKTLMDVEGKLTPAIDVNVGDMVRTHLGTLEPVTKKQIRPMNPATDWGVSLTTSTMPAFPGEYSDNHPIWKLFDGVFDFTDASKVRLNDYIGFPINTPQDCNEVCLQGKSYPLTPELAYAAGWLTRNALPNLEVMETLSQYPEDAVTELAELEQSVSPMITNAPLTHQLDFLRGYTEAAGYYPEAGAAPLQIYSPTLAYQLWVMLVSAGCIPTLMANKHGFKLVIPADSMHHLQGLWEGEIPKGSKVRGDKDAFFCGDYLCSRVTSARVVDLPEVISFEVAGTHTFCTAGVATHNSIMFEHIVPMRFAFPVNSMDLAQSIDLSDLQQNIAMQLREWRRDQNRVIVFPVQVVLDELGARGRALLLNPEIRQQAEMISIAMGFPPEFLMGGVSYCQSPDTLVHTDRGLLTLEEMTPDTQSTREGKGSVLNHEGVCKVSLEHHVGLKKAARMRTQHGLEVTGAYTHPVLTLQPDLSIVYKNLEDLQPGDHVGVKVGGELWPKEAPPIEFTSKLAGGRFNRAGLANVTIPTEVTPELARLLGYLVAEGSCSDTRRIGFGNTELEIMADVVDCIQKVFGYTPNIRVNRYRKDTKPFYQIEISRRQVVEFIRHLGIKGYSDDMAVPAIIRQSSWYLVSEFLKGYFEGDGGVSTGDTRQVIAAASKSRKLLQEIQLLLLNAGMVSTLYPTYRNRSTYGLVLRSSNVDVFAKKVGFVTDAKQAALKERTPTKACCVEDTVPYINEALRKFRETYFDGRSHWQKDTPQLDLTQQSYTTQEAAKLLDRDDSSVLLYIKSGALVAARAPEIPGCFQPWVIQRDDLQNFLDTHGVGVRKRTPKTDCYGMTYSKFNSDGLDTVEELDPELAKRIKEVMRLKLMWDKVEEVELTNVEIHMRDLTIEGVSAYQGNGVISHNSGSNVSLRIVENDLLFNFADNEDLLQYIANQVAWFMGWPTVQLRQKPFKMADDLQRAAFDANLTSQQMLSKSTLLQSRDYDPDTELEQVRKEIPIFGELVQQQTIMQARAQGAANLIGAQYGVQAAKIQSQGQGGPPVPAQMPPRATDDEGNELPPNDAAIMNAEQAISAYESPLAPGVMGMIPSEYANYVFDQISGLDPAEQTQAMQQVYTQSPGIASTVASMLAEKNMSQAASGRPLPEQLPPRRGPAKALI